MPVIFQLVLFSSIPIWSKRRLVSPVFPHVSFNKLNCFCHRFLSYGLVSCELYFALSFFIQVILVMFHSTLLRYRFHIIAELYYQPLTVPPQYFGLFMAIQVMSPFLVLRGSSGTVFCIFLFDPCSQNSDQKYTVCKVPHLTLNIILFVFTIRLVVPFIII